VVPGNLIEADVGGADKFLARRTLTIACVLWCAAEYTNFCWQRDPLAGVVAIKEKQRSPKSRSKIEKIFPHMPKHSKVLCHIV
jgi:hypothetical protein